MKKSNKMQLNQSSGMQDLTPKEMRELAAGFACYVDLLGCVGNTCCVELVCMGFSAPSCGDYDWYFNR